MSETIQKEAKKKTIAKGFLKVLESQAVPLDGLVAPLSKDSVFILVEALAPQICDHMDIALDILKGLNLNSDLNNNIFDQFLEGGYLVLKSGVTDENIECGGKIVDYFRQKRLRPAAKAYLFLDGKCLENSGDSLVSSYDVLDELKIPKHFEIAG